MQLKLPRSAWEYIFVFLPPGILSVEYENDVFRSTNSDRGPLGLISRIIFLAQIQRPKGEN